MTKTAALAHPDTLPRLIRFSYKNMEKVQPCNIRLELKTNTDKFPVPETSQRATPVDRIKLLLTEGHGHYAPFFLFSFFI